MDSFKHGNNSETSSEETDQPEKLANDDSAGTGRSYECNFCKRGFTNAQALGGHMNIHRKDKAKLAKSKQLPSEPSISNKLNKKHVVSSFFPPFMSDERPYNPNLGSPMSYQAFVPTQNASFLNMNSEYFSRVEKGCVGANLSLGIGTLYLEENEEKKRRGEIDINIKDDVDLELRLGHNP